MTLVNLKPSDEFAFTAGKGEVLLIACGALAREIVDLIEKNRWTAFDLQCLPAKWHNTPGKIVPGVREKIREARGQYRSIFVLYGDCGTGGLLDAMLADEQVERIAGPHCYAFFSGNPAFAAKADDDITSFFLTDYLARHFDKLIWAGLGIDRHPELLPLYFSNYTKIVYLAQTHDEDLAKKAMAAAKKLGLAYEYRFVGYGELASDLERIGAGGPA
ncbi:MAG: DUF1638 domain-containing protein [Rhizobiales bacterium]|nr:DUF1638 domain-containing protein [Hyphomicrobiales bacterium]MBI3672052.1 DUF1638 domain-containing protein [Hyphomicrobiales bacterium]